MRPGKLSNSVTINSQHKLVTVRRAKWRTHPRSAHDRHNWVVEDVIFGRRMVYSHFAFAIYAANLFAHESLISPLGLVSFHVREKGQLWP